MRLGRPGDGQSRHDAAWEARRNYDYVASGLAASGLVAPGVAEALRHELQDALVVRGLAPLGDFAGRAFPADEAMVAKAAPAGGPEVWLEAEIERHLALLATFAADERPDAGTDTLRILAGPVRALAAAGASQACPALVDQLIASLAAAGFDVEASGADPLAARPEWVRFLHERPISSRDDQPLSQARRLGTPVGELAGRQVVLRGLAWSSERMELSIAFGPPPRDYVGPEITALAVRALDDRERLHLGQLSAVAFVGGTAVQLRPGLDTEVSTLLLRITAGAECISSAVVL